MPATLQQALLMHQQGKLAEAERVYEALLQRDPADFEALRYMGVLQGQRGKGEAAVDFLSRAIARNPNSAEAHSSLGITLARLGRHEEALASYDKALAIKPDLAEAYNNRGNTLSRLNRREEAVPSYERALAARPDYVEAAYNLGTALAKLKRFDDAVRSFDRALALKPAYPEAYLNRGNALADAGRLDDALASFDAALKLRPDYVEVLHSRGKLLFLLGRYEQMIASCDRALALKPEHAETHYNRGIALGQLGRLQEAIDSYQKTLAVDPAHIDALGNLGNALQQLNRLQEAIASYDKAIELDPGLARMYSNRGTALAKSRRFEKAVADFDKAIALEPDYVEAHGNRATVLQQRNRHAEAAEGFERVLALRPDYPYALGGLAFSRAHMCDWRDSASLAERIGNLARSGTLVSEPFVLLVLSSSPQDQLAGAAAYVRAKHPPTSPPVWSGERYPHSKIRIAYLSADYHEHATAYLMAELFERHDRGRFEVTALSYGPRDDSPMRKRLIAGFDRFIEVREHSDENVARLMRGLEIDIAVDLKGFTTNCRPGILAFRPAPIQVNYLGHPGTMAAEYIDYLIADDFIVPQGQEVHYAEKMALLPDCYQPNDSQRRIAEQAPARASEGLPAQGFVFCCFNNNVKITLPVFEIWIRLLRQVEGSVLWLLKGNPQVEGNLRQEALRRGVAPERLVFAQRMKLEPHLARHRHADLFLDTLPYNAHTTASDALWTGLPVLTCAGTTFAGRVAGSLLRAVGLPELITSSLQEYEVLALKLATDSDLLNDVRRRLGQNRDAAPLFDADRFRRHIEAAYTTMWQTYQRGEAPRNFSVPSIGSERTPSGP
jgi:predicted O-linked N-acetylglucosamine transferase (SPINDLY family)